MKTLYCLTQEQVEFLSKLLKDMSFQGNLEQREIFNQKIKEIIQALVKPEKEIVQ